MRNKTTLAVHAALLMGCLCLPAVAGPVPQAIQNRYKTQKAAMEKPDLQAFDAYFAPDYVSVDPTGKSSDRATFLAGIHESMKGVKHPKFNIHLMSAKSHDGVVDVSFDMIGKAIASTGTMTVHEVGTDSWKKVGTDWQEIKTVDKVMDFKVAKAKNK